MRYFYLKTNIMAKQTGLFKFTGKLDNVIGYRRNGVHFVRSMPATVKQSTATRRASRNFGVASGKGKLIRRALLPYLHLRYDGTLVNRLNKTLIQSGHHQLQGLEGFRFNRHTGIEKLFPLPPALTAEGVLTLPAQALPKPGGATHLELRVIAARINFAERRIINTETVTELIDLNSDFNGLELPVPGCGRGTLLLVLELRACTLRDGVIGPAGDRRYMAVDVVGVVPPAAPAFRYSGRHNSRHGGEQRGKAKRPSTSQQGALSPSRQGALSPSLRGAAEQGCEGRRSNLLLTGTQPVRRGLLRGFPQ